MWNSLATHLKFWIWIPILLLIGFVVSQNYDFDITDVKMSVTSMGLAISYSAFLFVSGLGYFMLRNKKTNDYMRNFHLRATAIGTAIMLVCFVALAILFGNPDLAAANSGLVDNNVDGRLVLGILSAVVVLFFGTLTYVLNVIINLFFGDHFG